MNLLHNDSPAGRAIELVNDLVKQGRMSNAEARVIEDLVWHREFPQTLRAREVETSVTVTVGAPKFDAAGTGGRARPKSWFEGDQPPSYGGGDSLVPRRPVDAAP